MPKPTFQAKAAMSNELGEGTNVATQAMLLEVIIGNHYVERVTYDTQRAGFSKER